MTPSPGEAQRQEEDKVVEVPDDVKEALQKDVAGKGAKIQTPDKVVETKDGEYPMCEKLSALGTEQRTLGEFMEWLNTKELQLGTFHAHSDDCLATTDEEEAIALSGRKCGYRADELAVVHTKPEALIFEFLGIDVKQLDKERQEMLDKISA